MDDTPRPPAGGAQAARRDQVAYAERLAVDALALVAAARTGPDLAPALQRLGEQAERVLALVREPYKIGVIGEYGAGKTLFVASLLGFLDDLPIGDRATTGNVTRFRLRPAPQAAATTVAARSVVFLSRTETDACLADLARQIRDGGLAPGAAAPAAQAAGGDPWPLHEWLRTAGPLDDSATRLVAQLVAVSASAQRHGAVLGTTRPVSREELAELVQIPYASPVRPAEPPADLFWLVRQVELLLDVPAALVEALAGADAAAADGTTLELWDFPGILNHVSSERDRRLTEVLLHDVDTAVALLKAANPDGTASDELSRLLAAVNGGALAGVGNIFDSPQAIRFAEPGLDTDDAVQRRLPAVAELLRTARNLVPGESPLLYAGLVALSRLDPRPSLAGFDGRVGEQQRLAEAAHVVALRLPAASILRSALQPVTQDGGRAHAMACLRGQLATHGLRRRAERVEREHARLLELLEQLEAEVERAPAAGTVAADLEFHQVRSGLVMALSALRRSVPLQLNLALTGGDPGELPFARFVEQASACAVYQWPEWRRILGSVRGRDVRGGPELSDELIAPFADSCVEAFATVRAEALRRCERAVQRQAEVLLAHDPTLLPRARDLFAEHPGPWTHLGRPAGWRGVLTNPSPGMLRLVPYRAPDRQRYADAAPVRRNSRFLWSVTAPAGRRPGDADARHRRHPGYVIRLRHEFVAAAAYLMQSDIDALRAWAGEMVELFFDRLEDAAARTGPPAPPPGAQEARNDLLEAIRRLLAAGPDPEPVPDWINDLGLA
ncbi:hypothetical protein [Dactylosporangium sp. CA-139066]|uniref:hypothetical protein n=1 Tax=Dactylosporangium sp. CA-139066 TaxID=3239930 RepID=UPI003D8BDC88